jgi:hypothetical protein
MSSSFKIIFVLLSLIISFKGISQQLPHDAVRNMNSATPTPNSSAITPQQPLDVDLYTGHAKVGFELYSYNNAASGLNHSISLNYNGGGIRVDDIASNVGLGWNLNMGGVLNRTFNGLPDEVPYAGFMNASDTNWVEFYNGNTDAEMDVYNYIAGNTAGQFVIGKNNQIVSIPKSNVKIERNVVAIGNMAIACPNINFKITTENGLQYLYQTYNCSKTSPRDFYASSTWFLTQIISPFNTDTVFFNYSTKNLSYYAGTSHVRYLETYSSSSHTFSNDLTTASTGEGILTSIRYPDNTIVNFNYDVFKRLDFNKDSALANITITNGATSYGYKFNYSYFGPLNDYGPTNPSGLTGVWNDITYQNYNATAIVHPAVSEKAFRLKLKSFQKFSGVIANTLKGHQFLYDNTMLGWRGASSGIDNWGYQSSIAGSFYNLDRAPKLDGSQAASLLSIILPTGGSLQWDYELHTTASFEHLYPTNTLISKVFSSQIITNYTYSGPSYPLDESNVITMPVGMGVSTIYNKIDITPTGLGGPFSGTCWPTSVPNTIYVNLLKLVNGVYTSIGSLNYSKNELTSLIVKSFEITSTPTDQFKLTYYLDSETQCVFQAPSYYIGAVWNTFKDYTKVNIGNVGGIRVKKITQTDGVDPTKNIIKAYVYEHLSGMPSGVMINYPINTFPYFECYESAGGGIIYNSWGHPTYSPTGQVVTTPVNNTNYSYIVTTDNTVNRMYSSGGGIIGYACVQKFEGITAANNGKVVSEFSTFNNYSFLIACKANLYPFNPQAIADTKYGLPLKQTVYDVNGTMVKKTENTFLMKSMMYNIPEFRSRKIMLQTTACGATNEFGHIGDIYQCARYYPLTGISYLTNSKETKYFTNGDSLVTNTDIAYDTTYHVPVSTKITNSIGEVITQKQYYPFNYTVAGEIAALKNANIKVMPIANEIWKGTASPVLLRANANTFQTTATGIVKSLGSYSLLTATPINTTTWGTFNAAQLLQQPTLFNLEQTATSYDNKGNLLELNVNGKQGSFVYGYKKSRTIAEVSNASASEIGFTSFESDDKTAWTIFATSTATSDAHSGTTSMKVPANTTGIVRNFSPNTISGSQNKQYIFSCWVKTETGFAAGNGRLNIYSTYNTLNSTTIYPNVSGSFKTAAFSSINGKWQYIEVMIDLEQIHSLSGDNTPFQLRAYIENVDPGKYFLMDDVRFYPADAQMNSYTFNPLFGKTSESDANNLLTTYEYDVFGRLKLVRDKDANILQKTDYNYK